MKVFSYLTFIKHKLELLQFFFAILSMVKLKTSFDGNMKFDRKITHENVMVLIEVLVILY